MYSGHSLTIRKVPSILDELRNTKKESAGETPHLINAPAQQNETEAVTMRDLCEKIDKILERLAETNRKIDVLVERLDASDYVHLP